MSTTPSKTRIRADEFLEMDLGEGTHELVCGEIVAMPPSECWHGRICLLVALLLEDYGHRTGLGHAVTNDSRVLIDDENVRGADVLYYREARWPQERYGLERPPVPPDLIAEILSPNDRPKDVRVKVGHYLKAGVAVVWVIDPEKRRLTTSRNDDPTLTVLGETEIVEGLPELPGFRCRVAEFFSRRVVG